MTICQKDSHLPRLQKDPRAVQGTKDQALTGAFSVHVGSLADVQVDVGDHLEELLIRPLAETFGVEIPTSWRRNLPVTRLKNIGFEMI